jgi:hypothetical protein
MRNIHCSAAEHYTAAQQSCCFYKVPLRPATCSCLQQSQGDTSAICYAYACQPHLTNLLLDLGRSSCCSCRISPRSIATPIMRRPACPCCTLTMIRGALLLLLLHAAAMPGA